MEALGDEAQAPFSSALEKASSSAAAALRLLRMVALFGLGIHGLACA